MSNPEEINPREDGQYPDFSRRTESILCERAKHGVMTTLSGMDPRFKENKTKRPEDLFFIGVGEFGNRLEYTFHPETDGITVSTIAHNGYKMKIDLDNPSCESEILFTHISPIMAHPKVLKGVDALPKVKEMINFARISLKRFTPVPAV